MNHSTHSDNAAAQTVAENPAPIRTRIALVIRDDLPVWKKLNVTAFLSSGIAACGEPLVGDKYVDADGRNYFPMFAQPVVVYGASAEDMRRVFGRALERDLKMALFADELFATGNDLDNRAAIAAIRTDALNLAGFGVTGGASQIDKALKGLKLHP
jgi:hypothetical protein